jgi:hypothetical protein
MKHNYRDHPKCPHCDHELKDHYGYRGLRRDQNDYAIDCPSCGKEYVVEVLSSYLFTSKKRDCSSEHEWGAGLATRIDAKTCERWNAEGFLKARDWKPHTTWSRVCVKCEMEQFFHAPKSEQLALDSTDPWEVTK